MKVLSIAEVETIVADGRDLSESKLSPILDELEKDHVGVYRVIYGETFDAIAEINRNMAELYLDLAFDVIWVFRKQFGKPPEIFEEERWVSSKLSLIDRELKSLVKDMPMDKKIREHLQGRFIERSLESKIQMGLLEYLEDQLTRYVTFDNKRVAAEQLTMNLLFVLVRLMGDLYYLQTPKSA